MTLLALLLSYLLGSIPNGLWLCRALWHVDLRQHGSHNIGATNAWRTLGKGPGFLVFCLDKGFAAVALTEGYLAGEGADGDRKRDVGLEEGVRC